VALDILVVNNNLSLSLIMIKQFLIGAVRGDHLPDDVLQDIVEALHHPQQNLICIDSEDVARQLKLPCKRTFRSISEIESHNSTKYLLAYRSVSAVTVDQHRNWVEMLQKRFEGLAPDGFVVIVVLGNAIEKEWYVLSSVQKRL